MSGLCLKLFLYTTIWRSTHSVQEAFLHPLTSPNVPGDMPEHANWLPMKKFPYGMPLSHFRSMTPCQMVDWISRHPGSTFDIAPGLLTRYHTATGRPEHHPQTTDHCTGGVSNPLATRCQTDDIYEMAVELLITHTPASRLSGLLLAGW